MENKNKGQQIRYRETPIVKFQKINRWNICQAIAKQLYQSNIFDNDLISIANDFEIELYKRGFKNET